MYTVKNSDNVFLKNMYIVAISEKDERTKKIIKAYYKVTCKICRFYVTSIQEVSARKAIIAHIITRHMDVWLNHEPPLTEVNE